MYLSTKYRICAFKQKEKKKQENKYPFYKHHNKIIEFVGNWLQYLGSSSITITTSKNAYVYISIIQNVYYYCPSLEWVYRCMAELIN